MTPKVNKLPLALILSASLLLVLVGVVQFFYTRTLLEKEEERISRMELKSHTDAILHMLELSEMTMRENVWSIRQSLDHPDSLFSATQRMIESNPLVAGACIAVVPGYYPQKGPLFETYAYKAGDGIAVEQIAGPDHDYTESPYYRKALREEADFWSDPYEYGEDPVQQLTTYSYPVSDRAGRLAAICGLDIDLTWLSDTLNANQYYPSSFGFLLNGSGELVAGPKEDRTSPKTVQYVVDLMADSTAVRSIKGHNRVTVMGFRDPVSGKKAFVNYKPLTREPGWIVAQVSYREEVVNPVRKMMRRILLMALACLGFLLFIIERFFRNERRLREADVRQARLGSELRIAGRIQEEMLPKAIPEREDLAVYSLLTPAKEVGGDLFDYFVRDGKLFFCIGDVSGKSVPAAMVMAVIQSLFRMVSTREDDPAAMVTEINREGCRNNVSGMFVTFFCGVLDLASGVLRYCNAGHDHPVVVDTSAGELPALANLPIGAMDGYEFKQQEAVIPRGSCLFLYTDGVTESMDSQRRQFGRKRLLETLEAGPRNPEELVRRVERVVRNFVGETEQHDDITMLAIRYDGPAEGPSLDENLTLVNDLSQVRPLTDFVQGLADRAGLDARAAKSLRLAMEEIVVNVINYAYPAGKKGGIAVRARSDGKKLRLTVIDSGVPFDPTAAPPVDTTLPVEDRSVGGLGIHLARTLMDAVHYERKDGKNVLTLEKNL